MKEVRYEDAVSEVVGTILVLAITVALFSTVFVYVQVLPPANSPDQVTFSSDFSYSPTRGILHINLTEKAGNILSTNEYYLMVSIDGREYSTPLSSLNFTGPLDQGNHNNLGPGDTVHWKSSLDSIAVSDNSTFYSVVVSRNGGQLLWKSQDYTASQLSINAVYSSPNHLVGGQNFIIVAQIFTMQPSFTHVFINLESISGYPVNETMTLYTQSSNTLTFYYNSIAPSTIPSNAVILIYAENSGSRTAYSMQL